MSTWEYRTLAVPVDYHSADTGAIDEELNRLGKQEWELLSVTPVVHAGETQFLVHHFRKLAEPARKAGFHV